MTNCNDNQLCTTEARAERRVERPNFRTESNEGELRLFVELPGVAREDIELGVRSGVLELEAKSSLEPADGPALRRHVEFRLADFAMRWRLGEDVDADGITSELVHGVLRLTLPLRKPERRAITISG